MNATELTTAEQEVWAIIKAFNRAFAANDSQTYFTYIHEDITVIIPGSPYRIEGIEPDREEFEYGLAQGYSRVGYFQELQPKIFVNGDMAVVTYYSRGQYGPQGATKTAYLKETDVLVRRNGAWKLFHIHVSATV